MGCTLTQAYGFRFSNASRILNEHSVWKRPVPFSEPGASLLLGKKEH